MDRRREVVEGCGHRGVFSSEEATSLSVKGSWLTWAFY